MNETRKAFAVKQTQNLRKIVVCLASLLLLAGCTSQYGKIKTDPAIQQAFESHQVPSGYKYFTYTIGSTPYVIFGIDSKYEMNSKMWREIAPDTEEFKKAVFWIWEDYFYYKFGANILDPAGNKVGIYYSSITDTAFQFKPNNQIVVMPGTPFLGGPGDLADMRTP